MKESKILLIGGNGLLGKCLKQVFLLNQFYNVYTFSRANLEDPMHIQGSLSDKVKILQLAKENFDYIINLSGQITNPINDCLDLNSVGIENLIQLVNSSSTSLLIQISTVGVYGSSNFVDEQSYCNPETPYSVAKNIAERLLMAQLTSNRIAILRLSNLYGEQQFKGIFAYLNHTANKDRNLHFNNNGNLVRYYLHVNDCASYIFNLIVKKNTKLSGVYNLIGEEKYSIKELIKLFEDFKQIYYTVKFENLEPYDNILNISNQKIRNELNYQPKMNIKSYMLNILSND